MQNNSANNPINFRFGIYSFRTITISDPIFQSFLKEKDLKTSNSHFKTFNKFIEQDLPSSICESKLYILETVFPDRPKIWVSSTNTYPYKPHECWKIEEDDSSCAKFKLEEGKMLDVSDLKYQNGIRFKVVRAQKKKPVTEPCFFVIEIPSHNLIGVTNGFLITLRSRSKIELLEFYKQKRLTMLNQIVKKNQMVWSVVPNSSILSTESLEIQRLSHVVGLDFSQNGEKSTTRSRKLNEQFSSAFQKMTSHLEKLKKEVKTKKIAEILEYLKENHPESFSSFIADNEDSNSSDSLGYNVEHVNQLMSVTPPVPSIPFDFQTAWRSMSHVNPVPPHNPYWREMIPNHSSEDTSNDPIELKLTKRDDFLSGHRMQPY